MNWNKRIMLLLAYTLASLITYKFFVGSIHGTSQPMSIMLSWGVVVIILLGPSRYNTAIFFLYPLSILFLNNALRRIINFPVPLVSLVIHGIGTCVALVKIHKELVELSPEFNLLGWIIPVPVVIAYHIIDWRLAIAAKKPVPANS